MTNKIVLVTAPDDILIDGVRLLLVGLTPEQQKIVSDALVLSDIESNIVTYLWNPAHTDWSIDKKHKSDLIIFNAEYDDLVVGYLSAQPNSHYFGTLRLFGKVNTSELYDVDQVLSVIQSLNKQVF